MPPECGSAPASTSSGPDELVRLYHEEDVGFVVYKAEMTFKEGAKLGDVIEVRTTVEPSSDFRLVFQQDIYHQGRGTLMVQGLVHLVTVDHDQRLVKTPELVRAVFTAG